MKDKTKNILLTVSAYIIVASLFIYMLVTLLQWGAGLLSAIFNAVISTIVIVLIIVFSVYICWRLFTPEGRELEKKTQERKYIEKLKRKRDREWKQMNK